MGNDRLDKPELPANPLNTAPPLYAQLRDLLIERVRSFVWKPGCALPNEVALANEFHVSIGTVRKAMDDLSSRGLVVRHQGRGTFVADVHRPGASLLDQIRRPDGSTITWDPPHTSVTVGSADRREKALFEWLPTSAPLLRFEWLTGIDGRRMVLQQTSVPSELVGIGTSEAKHVQNLDEVLGRAKILVDRTEIALSVAPAGPDISTQLKVASGTCLQRLQRRFFDLKDKPVAISDDWLALTDEVYAYIQPRRNG